MNLSWDANRATRQKDFHILTGNSLTRVLTLSPLGPHQRASISSRMETNGSFVRDALANRPDRPAFVEGPFSLTVVAGTGLAFVVPPPKHLPNFAKRGSGNVSICEGASGFHPFSELYEDPLLPVSVLCMRGSRQGQGMDNPDMWVKHDLFLSRPSSPDLAQTFGGERVLNTMEVITFRTGARGRGRLLLAAFGKSPSSRLASLP
ncbi:uncharacterized protein P884DRAFT_271390 [Thermothelomyces heterothallicus CBS 202.75]|uniref:uncharacterized protein n=1 Tax=Thermothelomyces heterothallicus CBS 202.75 TaxID=1149848 RepID=UPI003743B480